MMSHSKSTPSSSSASTFSSAHEIWFKYVETSWEIQPKDVSVCMNTRETISCVVLPSAWNKRFMNFLRSKPGRLFTNLSAFCNVIALFFTVAFASPFWKHSSSSDTILVLTALPSFIGPYLLTILVSNAKAVRLVLKQFDTWYCIFQALVLTYGHCIAQEWGVRALLLTVPIFLGSVLALLGDGASNRKVVIPSFLMACLANATLSLLGFLRPVNVSSLMSSATITVVLFKLSFVHQTAASKGGQNKNYSCAVIKFPLQRLKHVSLDSPQISGHISTHKSTNSNGIDLPLSPSEGNDKELESEQHSPAETSAGPSLSMIAPAPKLSNNCEEANIHVQRNKHINPPDQTATQMESAVVNERKGEIPGEISIIQKRGKSHTAKSRSEKVSSPARRLESVAPKERYLEARTQGVCIRHRTLICRRPLAMTKQVMSTMGHGSASVTPSNSSAARGEQCEYYLELPKYVCLMLFVIGTGLLWYGISVDLSSSGAAETANSSEEAPTIARATVSVTQRHDERAISTSSDVDRTYVAAFVLISTAVGLLMGTNTNKELSKMLLRSFQANFLALSLVQLLFAIFYLTDLPSRLLGIFTMGLGFFGWVVLCDAVCLSSQRRTGVAVCIALQLASELLIGLLLFSKSSALQISSTDSRLHLLGTSINMQSVALDGLVTMIAFTCRTLVKVLLHPEEFILLQSDAFYTSKTITPIDWPL